MEYEDTSKFLEALNPSKFFDEKGHNPWTFRGHSNSDFKLEPTLYRKEKKFDAIAFFKERSKKTR